MNCNSTLINIRAFLPSISNFRNFQNSIRSSRWMLNTMVRSYIGFTTIPGLSNKTMFTVNPPSVVGDESTTPVPASARPFPCRGCSKAHSPNRCLKKDGIEQVTRGGSTASPTRRPLWGGDRTLVVQGVAPVQGQGQWSCLNHSVFIAHHASYHS